MHSYIPYRHTKQTRFEGIIDFCKHNPSDYYFVFLSTLTRFAYASYK